MTGNLVAHFAKRFQAGATIEIDFTQAASSSNVVALLGPSGCGKTTMLRCLAGLTNPDRGEIRFCDETWFSSDQKIRRTPQQRDIGFLFQDYALFPHLSVDDNIGFGIRSLSMPQRRQRVNQMITQFDLTGLERRFPRQISGGQQQRVALARALARRPKLLLLDEPLSSLDALLRDHMRSELRQRLVEMGIPAIIVTHDRVEAVTLADHVALMDEGLIRQFGTIQDVFARPADPHLARLVGIETIVDGEIVEEIDGLVAVHVGSTRLLAVAPSLRSRHVHVCIKGEDVALQKGDSSSTSVRNHLISTVTSLTREGPLIRVGLDCGFELSALITRLANDDMKLKIGEQVVAMVKTPAIHLIPCPEKS